MHKITCLTAYDYPTAKILDDAGIDIILVGDSVGNVMLGHKSTRSVSILDMIHHTKAVSNAVNKALVVADLPFLSVKKSSAAAYKDAVSLIKAGADAVKIEGIKHIGLIKKLIRNNIPVMGHIGYTPQSVNKPHIFGKTPAEKVALVKQAILLDEAGVFSIVLELIDKEAAKRITNSVSASTIGIGSGPYCSGQVMVTPDIIGLTAGKVPSFVRQYADVKKDISEAVKLYIKSVTS